MRENKNFQKALQHPWFMLMVFTTMSVYIYIFFEWLFFVSKPSFMSTMGYAQKLEILFLTSFTAVMMFLGTLFIFAIFDRLLPSQYAKKALIDLGKLLPAGILSGLGFIMIDNFSYTVFKFGVVTTTGIWRSGYAFLFLILFFFSYRYISQQMALPEKKLKTRAFLALALLAISAIIAINTFALRAKTNAEKLFDTAQSDLPNIILLGIDGVNATHLPIYGYDRDTTPNIRNLAKDALIAENAFPNGSNTAGSTISMLTGKLPTETHLIYPPDILTGKDTYQHLPGMLRQMGYQTVQITAYNYADAYSLNLLDGFDSANFRSEDSALHLGRISFLGNDISAYFLGVELNRISERLQHAFYLRTMNNPYKVVTEPTTAISELQRVEGLLAFLDQSDGPVFAHIHMMGTHGPNFNPRQQVFSAGKQQDNPWMTDFYDDAILDFDLYVGDIVEHLVKTGKLENTIIIIYSDHGMKYQTNERVPLIIRFPNGERAGRLRNNVQNLDIAPTILDYLGVPQPEWMSGQSLIQGEPSIERPIFAAFVAYQLLIQNEDFWKIDQNKLTPPFYQLGQVSLIICNRWYKLDLVNSKLFYGDVQGHTAPCAAGNLPDPEQAISIILDHLAENGYDVSAFPKEIPIIMDDANQ